MTPASTTPAPSDVTDAAPAPDAARAMDAGGATDAAASSPTHAAPTPDASTAADARDRADAADASHACPPDPGHNQDVPVVNVVFPGAGGAVIHAWVVTTLQDQERGLMYRTSMPADQGMLFELKDTGNYQFWMKDTCIPLDLIFADADGKIVGIVENTVPLDTTPRGVSSPSRNVLEVNGGWTHAHGVKTGQTMTLPAPAK